ncbi:MAG TPA: arsenite methyltransferase, partial [Stellaceae bacterium]|nr:arsenite methyltransferase [Stellaceae bacterium]
LAISDVVNIAPLPTDLRADPTLICGCVAGAASRDKTEACLAEAGFVAVRVTPRPESRDLIKTWEPGRRVEDYVVSAFVEGRKP